MSLGTREHRELTAEELDAIIVGAATQLVNHPHPARIDYINPNPLIAKLFPAPKQAVEKPEPPAELETERPKRQILH